MSDILRRARPVNRVIFDPTDDAHIESFKTFLVTGSWGAVQFYPEAPYTEAPATVMARFSRHVLKVQEEDSTARAERLAARNIVTATTAESALDRAARLNSSNALISAQLKAYEEAVE